MSTLNRRNALTALAVLPASIAAPAALAALPSAHLPDSELLAAARAVQECDPLLNAGDNDPLLWRRYNEAYARIHSLRATTLEGIKAKARVAKLEDFDNELLMTSIARDLLALGATG